MVLIRTEMLLVGWCAIRLLPEIEPFLGGFHTHDLVGASGRDFSCNRGGEGGILRIAPPSLRREVVDFALKSPCVRNGSRGRILAVGQRHFKGALCLRRTVIRLHRRAPAQPAAGTTIPR